MCSSDLVTSLLGEKHGVLGWNAYYGGCSPVLDLLRVDFPHKYRCKMFNDAVWDVIQEDDIKYVALVTAQKLLLLQDNPNLVRDSDGEIARLRNNLNLLQEFKESEREQEQLAEHTGAEDIELHTQALADVKRLRLSIEADVDKETAVYNQLFSQVFNA